MLDDSRARALVVSAALLPSFLPILAERRHLRHVIVSGDGPAPRPPGALALDALLAQGDALAEAADTTRDDVAFWLYSSGSTGAPKGTMHVHASLVTTAYLHGGPIVGVREDDVVFSAAKLFFAYGLGNALTFPMTVGATAILMAERPTPDAVFKRLKRAPADRVLRRADAVRRDARESRAAARDEVALRIATSAGEALPESIGRRFAERFGIDVLDGIGSTEMLHVFLSNRPGDVRYGTSGRPVPGYRVRVVDDDGAGRRTARSANCRSRARPTAAGYWNQREKSRATLPRRLDAHRRQVPPGRRRPLRLRRAAATTCSRSAASTSRRSRWRRR